MQNIKHVLITGGAGFIGSELARQFSERNIAVTIVDNLVNGNKENLADVLNDKVQLVQLDIRELEQMESLMQGVDVVYHLACLGVRHSIHSPLENHEVNATATLQLLEIAKKIKIPRFVYVSSSEVYGTARWAPMTEEHPTFPMTVYGSAKLAGECYTRAFFETYEYPTVVVRPFNAYGPRCHHEGDSGEVIPKFMLRCLAQKPLKIFGDGKQTRDFTFVSDTARGIRLAGLSDEAVGQTINLGSGKETTVVHLAEMVASVLNVYEPEIHFEDPRPGDVLRLCADSKKAKELLNFEPEISLKDGLNELKKWYLSLGKTVEELLKDEVSKNWQGSKAVKND